VTPGVTVPLGSRETRAWTVTRRRVRHAPVEPQFPRLHQQEAARDGAARGRGPGGCPEPRAKVRASAGAPPPPPPAAGPGLARLAQLSAARRPRLTSPDARCRSGRRSGRRSARKSARGSARPPESPGLKPVGHREQWTGEARLPTALIGYRGTPLETLLGDWWRQRSAGRQEGVWARSIVGDVVHPDTTRTRVTERSLGLIAWSQMQRNPTHWPSVPQCRPKVSPLRPACRKLDGRT
jgi:hypothetical protein